jgi:DNA repair protein RadC
VTASVTALPAALPLVACPLPPSWTFRPGDPADRPQVACPEDAVALVMPLLAGRDREHCLLVALDTKHRLLTVSTVSVGTTDHTFMAPREIFRDALLAGASALFVAHNHPSGDPSPSADDRQITRRLSQAGSLLGVELLDHVVIGDPGWKSLAREGVI